MPKWVIFFKCKKAPNGISGETNQPAVNRSFGYFDKTTKQSQYQYNDSSNVYEKLKNATSSLQEADQAGNLLTDSIDNSFRRIEISQARSSQSGVMDNHNPMLDKLQVDYQIDELAMLTILDIEPINNTQTQDSWDDNDKTADISQMAYRPTNKKVQALINQQRTNLADVEYLDLKLVESIVQNFGNVKQSAVVQAIKKQPI